MYIPLKLWNFEIENFPDFPDIFPIIMIKNKTTI